MHLGTTTVKRLLNKSPVQTPTSEKQTPEESTSSQTTATTKEKPVVTSKRPNHIWLVDLTIVPILSGMWTTWLPFALPLCWPFCYWLCVVIDHKSRKVLKVQGFRKQPSRLDVCRVLDAAIKTFGRGPKYLICDKGGQFGNDKFKRWANQKSIRLRFGAVGQHGSIALIERLIWNIKYEWLRDVDVPARMRDFQSLLNESLHWHNAYRPHMALGGRTPNEVYFHRSPANEKPRIEPRKDWPRRSGCALPKTKVLGKCGPKFVLRVRFHCGENNRPLVTLRRAG